MRGPRASLGLILSVALVTGLLCSQVCAFNCALSPASFTSTPAGLANHPSGHECCHSDANGNSPEQTGQCHQQGRQDPHQVEQSPQQSSQSPERIDQSPRQSSQGPQRSRQTKAGTGQGQDRAPGPSCFLHIDQAAGLRAPFGATASVYLVDWSANSTPIALLPGQGQTALVADSGNSRPLRSPPVLSALRI
jgi:hypothetical protein